MNGQPAMAATVYVHAIDAAAMRSAVTDWVDTRHGSISAVTERQLIVTLSSSDMALFLQRFSSDGLATLNLNGATPSSSQVTIQVELVLPQE